MGGKKLPIIGQNQRDLATSIRQGDGDDLLFIVANDILTDVGITTRRYD